MTEDRKKEIARASGLSYWDEDVTAVEYVILDALMSIERLVLLVEKRVERVEKRLDEAAADAVRQRS